MDANPNPEVAPPTSLEPEHEINDTTGQPYVNNQDIPETTEPTETTESTVVDGTHDAGYNHEEQAHQNTYPAEFTSSQQNYFPAEDEQNSSRFSSPTMSYQQNPQQSVSRPGSGLSSGGERYGYPSSQPEQNQKQAAVPSKNSVVIKVGMVGDAQIGKTSLMVKYVEGSWDEDYIQTLGERDLSYRKSILYHLLTRGTIGVNFMEKTISIRNTEITFSIWDLGGQREFVNMLPLVCNDAVAILFMFDLTRKSTLNSIKEWYRQGRGFNKTAIPFLIGTKYDHFVNFPREDQEEISLQVCRAKLKKAHFCRRVILTK
ncbi:hypothetical protein EIK77_010079 [Talaromyces pinophilus]|nr:hypothetical protein EIK77_010079 [Talaromyces pinophilus]